MKRIAICLAFLLSGYGADAFGQTVLQGNSLVLDDPTAPSILLKFGGQQRVSMDYTNSLGLFRVLMQGNPQQIQLASGSTFNPPAIFTIDVQNGVFGIGTYPSAPAAKLDLQNATGDYVRAGSVFRVDNTGTVQAHGVSLKGAGVTFPDGSVQNTASVQGPPGPQGPQGLTGPAGPQGPPGPTQSLVATSIIQTYSNSIDITCPGGYTVVTASCKAGTDVVINAQNSPTQSGSWQSWLTPNTNSATGVHCAIGLGNSSTVLLRCAKLQ